MTWDVRLITGAIKKLRQLPQGIQEIFQLLLVEIELSGPIRKNWPKFSKLSHKNCYHCHLRKGRPTHVAVWRISDKESRIVEVTYVGTHERAHYDRLC